MENEELKDILLDRDDEAKNAKIKKVQNQLLKLKSQKRW